MEGFDPEALKLLAAVFAGKSVEDRAEWIFVNFEKYSRIVGRRNIAKVTLLAYFTPIWVAFNGELQKGWANILIVGDTTTGKSETVSKAICLLFSNFCSPLSFRLFFSHFIYSFKRVSARALSKSCIVGH